VNRSARAAAAAGTLILAVRYRGARFPQGVDGRRGHVILFQCTFELFLSYLSRVDQRFDRRCRGLS
jgi:hypothetical protein